MCLYVDEKECKVADHDITVYKYVARRAKSVDGTYTKSFKLLSRKQLELVWVSPYCRETMKIEYKLGEIILDEQFEAIAKEFYTFSQLYGIFHGLHTFADESSAKDRACNFTTTDGWNGVLECVIPAGTRYWTDIDRSEYCSESLRVEKLVFQTYEKELIDFVNSNE